MKYAIYGAGSLGIVLGAFLAKNGEKFDIIDRNPKSVDALNEKGAIVVGTIQMTEKVNAILDTNVQEKYDIIFLVTKQIGNLEIIKKISKFLAEDGVICTMQNGLPEKDVAEVIGDNRTYGCAVAWGATRIEPGRSELTSNPERQSLSFSFGSMNGQKGEKFDEIIRILSIMGDVQVEENFIGARWSKLLINSAFSGMSTVCGKTFGEVAKYKPSRKIIQRIIKECIDVAFASGIKIEPIQGKDVVKILNYKNSLKKWLSFIIIPIAIKKHRLLKASMLQDIEKGIPCEIDYINGIVSNFGKQVSIPTPFNDKVIEIVHKLESGELTPSLDNVKYFEQLF
ncbi:MAG: ketopantoate reductase family protein [Erysipelotrichales bacterium]|nr:ketopantoate reductase family protein [Erysipelotrichales bacterium]